MKLTRRHILLGAVSLVGLAVAGRFAMRSQPAAAETFAVTHTDAEWQKLLTAGPVCRLAPGGDGTRRQQPAAE